MIKKLLRATLAIGVLLLASCTSKTEYTHAIPKNASVVIGMEVDDMAHKAGLNGQEGEKVLTQLKTLLKGGLQAEGSQLAERIIDHPSESGLSFSDKVYLFATPHAEALGILAKVSDEGKLERVIEMLEKESIAAPLREESGCQWTEAGTALCAFNNGTFLLLQPSKGNASAMKGTLLSLMRQKEGEGFSALPEFERIKAEGNDVASVMNLSAIPHEMTTPLRMGLSADIRLEDIKYFITTNFESGKVVVNSESLIQNPKISAFFDTMDQVIQPIQGKYLDYYQGNTLIWAGGNIDGKELYQMLSQNPTIKQILKNPPLPVDVENIFSSIKGDFAIGLDRVLSKKFLLYADVTNSDLLKTFEDLRPLLALTGGQITLDNVGPHDYMMSTYYGKYWFGITDNRLYVTTDRIWAEEVGRTYGVSIGRKPWANEVKANRLYASLNMSEIPKYRTKITGEPSIDEAINFLRGSSEFLNVSMTDWRHGKVEVVLKDKNTNLLEWLVDILKK